MIAILSILILTFPVFAADSFEETLKKAENGDAIAQELLGTLYTLGNGVPKDYKKAAEWYEKAASQGVDEAQYSLGMMYYDGIGVPQDYINAYVYFNLAAASDHNKAIFKIYLVQAIMSRDQIEKAQNISQELFKKIVDNKKFAADVIEAAIKKAESGDAKAQYELGLRYAAGANVPRNDKKAFEWYEKSALQGNATAQYNLGMMYSTGTGVPNDDKKALEWLEKAALQGEKEAQYNLGMIYYTGFGAPRDYMNAYVYFNIAATGNHEYAIENRKQIQEKMTPAQIEKAQELSRELFKKITDNNKMKKIIK